MPISDTSKDSNVKPLSCPVIPSPEELKSASWADVIAQARPETPADPAVSLSNIITKKQTLDATQFCSDAPDDDANSLETLPDTSQSIPESFIKNIIKPGEVRNPEGRSGPGKKFARYVRTFLEATDPSLGAGRSTQARLVRVLDNIYKQALKNDAKSSVGAAKLLLTYAYGQPRPSDEAVAAVEKGGVRILVLPQAPDRPDPIAPKLIPEFIHAEVVNGELVEPKASESQPEDK